MALIAPPSATISIPANSLAGTISGDMSSFNVQIGMDIFIGSRNGRNGNSRILTAYALTGNTGATFSIGEAYSSSAVTNMPFVVDNMAVPQSTVAQNVLNFTVIANALRRFLGVDATLDQASKTLYLDRAAGTGTFGRVRFSVAQRVWFGLEHYTLGGLEKLLLRAYPDGSTPLDVMTIDGSTGAISLTSFLSPKPSASGSIANASTGRSGFQIESADTSSDAYMSFWAKGWGAAYFGLGNDGGFYVGGVSYGAIKERLLTQGNFHALPVQGIKINGAGGIDMSYAGSITFTMRNTSAPVDCQNYDSFVDNSGNLVFRTVNNAYNTAYSWMAIRRIGYVASEWNPYVTFCPYVDFTYNVGVSTKRFYQMWSGGYFLDTNHYLAFGGANPIWNVDAGDYLYYDRANDWFAWVIGGVARTTLTSGSFAPNYDSGQYLGTPNSRWNSIYSNSATINTSDATEKTPKRPFSDDELDAWNEVSAGAFQFLDAVATKGEDGARIHYGYIAQEVHAAFASRGLDAGRLALWCADERTVRVTKTRTITRPKMETVSRQESYVEIVDSRAVEKVRSISEERQVRQRVPMFGPDGKAVLDRMPDPAHPDDPDKFVEIPRYHEEFVTEEVEETYEVQEPTGQYRYGLRYDGCHVIEAAYQRRRADRIEARLAALEGAGA